MRARSSRFLRSRRPSAAPALVTASTLLDDAVLLEHHLRSGQDSKGARGRRALRAGRGARRRVGAPSGAHGTFVPRRAGAARSRTEGHTFCAVKTPDGLHEEAGGTADGVDIFTSVVFLLGRPV